MTLQRSVDIEDDSQIGEARRLAANLASAAHLPAEEAGRVAIVVNELGSNIRKHARRGQLILRALPSAMEILALDKGPGMNFEASLRDGHSTAGTRGEGLGAVRRLAQEFDAFSTPQKGTVVLARISSSPPKGALQFGAISLPLRSETECGDGFCVEGGLSVTRILVVDGLGHGPLAAQAAQAAQAAFRDPSTQKLPGPEAMLHVIHAALRSTRGAAVGIAELDLVARKLRFGGIGNVSATLDSAGARPRGLLSHNGIAGHEAPRIQQFELPWPARALLVVQSDGLGTHWKLDAYSGLHARHAAVIAGVLFRDFRRPTDDSTVVVIKEP